MYNGDAPYGCMSQVMVVIMGVMLLSAAAAAVAAPANYNHGSRALLQDDVYSKPASACIVSDDADEADCDGPTSVPVCCAGTEPTDQCYARAKPGAVPGSEDATCTDEAKLGCCPM